MWPFLTVGSGLWFPDAGARVRHPGLHAVVEVGYTDPSVGGDRLTRSKLRGSAPELTATLLEHPSASRLWTFIYNPRLQGMPF